MKKIITSIILFSLLLFPSISFAQLSQAKIQKEMTIARYELDKAYGVELNKKIDQIFAKKIISNDTVFFKNLNDKLNTYFSKKTTFSQFLKKEKLYKYLYIRTTYELKYRTK